MVKKIPAIADLIKYKLSLAVALSSVTGYFLCRNTIDIHLVYLAAGIFLLSSGAAALNQYTERDTYLLMDRTRSRPIPSKKISEPHALKIASVCVFSGSLLLLFNGIIPFLLGILNVLLYNLLYTRLKKITVFSVIPGALVGALPPMIGFSSADGSLLHPYIIAFSAFMFLWQLPHFWLIIIKYGNEYKAAGFATISTWLNDTQIRYLVFFWVFFTTCLLSFFFLLTDVLNSDIFILLSSVNIIFIVLFYKLLFQNNGTKEIRKAFILINSLSLLVMLSLILTSLLRHN